MKTDAARKQADFILRYALQSLGLILVVAVLVRTFLVSSYVMSGSSMLPSIWPGDFIIAVKFWVNEPKRGDVVVLKCPNTKDRICLKRVVGIQGDRVEFIDGAMVVNGKKVHSKILSAEFAQETVENSTWAIWPSGKGITLPAPVIVPPQHLYVLNDKRSDLDDSRTWGPVPSDLLDGRASRVWLSLDWFERTGEVRNWPRVRWSRLFHGIN